MVYETLILEQQEGVGIITLNRPEQLNALNVTLTTELDRALSYFEGEDEVKAIIITGAGDKAFSAGGDIHEMTRQSEAGLKQRGSRRVDQNWHLATCQKPTIGAINGLAYGGAALLSSTFDIRIGCELTSFRFLGVAYGRVNSTWTLPLIVGWPIAKELLFTGRVVEAEEALRIGLLNKLVSSSELMKAAIDMGQAIAANNPASVQGIKEILIKDIGMSWRKMLLNEAQMVSEALKPPPPEESFRDFLDRKGSQ
ncbi:MAG: enoyl-CoA hydratase/isomerase family protein [Dehalococcoidales bacterium]|nr:MAG: enoyl-CoA hydratase/isomerase family protein [Dehalococcoidales bacterium]